MTINPPRSNASALGQHAVLERLYALYGALVGITTQERGNEGRNENPPRSNAPALGQHAVLDRLYALYGALVGITTQERGNEGKT